MGKSKFIDKKKAVQYRLVHRPSEESGLEHDGAEGSHVFERMDRTDLPSPLVEGEEGNDEEYEDEYEDEDESGYRARLAAYEARRRELLELGFADDGYDYLQHLRVIKRSTGAMFMAVEKPRAPDNDIRLYDASKAHACSTAPTDEEEALLVGAEATTRQLRRQPQQLAEGLDAEVAAALEDEAASDDGSSALLEDDFIALAMEGLDEPAGEGTSAAEAHWLLRAAEEADTSEQSSDEDDVRWESDSALDAAPTATGSGSQEHGSHRASRPSRVLDEQFEQLALREYDSDDMGELEEDDPSTRNTASISQYSSVLDEFLSNPDVTAVDYELKFPSMDAAVRSKTKPSRLPDVLEDKPLDTQQDLAEDGASTSSDNDEIVRVEDPEPEEQWDCESAVTMLSNLDNHPGRISERHRASRQAPLATIHLTGKHQLPAGFEGSLRKPQERGSSQPAAHRTSSQSSAPPAQRKRDESAEERKARKAEVKAARRDARASKKSLKTLFKDAEKLYKGAKSMPSTIPVA
eukprot:jgi/Chlat1/9147/Chrsp97S08437